MAARRWLRVRMWLWRSIFEVAEEANEALERQIGEHEPGDPTSLVCGDEHQDSRIVSR